MTPRVKLISITVAASLLINAYHVFANYYAVSENGTNTHMWVSVLLMLPAVGCLILSPVFLIATISKRVRSKSITGLIITSIFFSSAFICIHAGGIVRDSAFRDLAERSNHLIYAIEDYQRKTGRPPQSLTHLVPEYLVSIPTTQMGAYPEYEYYSGEDAQKYGDNLWVLVIQTPSGGINWDMFMYYPLQNYPDGGSWERFGRWVYVHE